MWSCSNRPSSNMFLTERKSLKFTGLRDGITCVVCVCVRAAFMVLSDLPLIINQERPLPGNIEII